MRRRAALCIGVEAYDDDEINNLLCAAADADDTHHLLRERGFDPVVRLTQPHRLTVDAITQELAAIEARLRPGDLFVLYFAGHGKTLPGPRGQPADQLFLLPRARAALLDPDTLTGAPGLLSWRMLKRQTELGGWAGVQRLFIFDACRSPLLRQELKRDGHAATAFEGARVFRDFGLRTGPATPFEGHGLCTVINSCSDGQQAEELPKQGHGKFTALLLQHLRSAAGRTLTLDQAFAQGLQQAMGKEQTPMLVGEPVVMWEAAPAVSAPPLPPQRPAPPPGPSVFVLMASFERQLAAGRLWAPADDCAVTTLAAMQAAAIAAGGSAADVASHQARLNEAIARAMQPPAPPSPPPSPTPAPVPTPPSPPRVEPKPDRPTPIKTTASNPSLLAGAGLGLAAAAAAAGALWWALGQPKSPTPSPAPSVAAAPAPAPTPPVIAPAPPPAVAAAPAPEPFRRMEPLLQVAGCDECGQMAVLNAGVFDMGSLNGEPGREALYKGSESPLRLGVRVGRFEIGRTEVTQGQWKAVMGGKNPSGFEACGDACPVEGVSWNEIVGPGGFLERLNRQLGLSGAGAYRLPTEAEWEYAARAGTKTAFWWGSRITPGLANYDGRAEYEGGGSKGENRQKMVKANSFEPNGWGLYNVHGNVWEWMQDSWHDSYWGAPADGGEWVAGADMSRRVVRGGSWLDHPGNLRSAFRKWVTPGERRSDLGFRLARTY